MVWQPGAYCVASLSRNAFPVESESSSLNSAVQTVELSTGLVSENRSSQYGSNYATSNFVLG